MNSEEFKDLGTLHYEKRLQEYVPQNEVTMTDLAKKRLYGNDVASEIIKGGIGPAGANPSKKWKLK